MKVAYATDVSHWKKWERDAEITRLLRSVEPFTLHLDRPRTSRERGGVAYPIRPVCA